MAGRVPTAYERLGVVPEASAAEITSAYRRLLRRHHPDSRDGSQVLDHDDRGAGDNAADVLAAIIDAYAVLRDPASRAEYDRSQQPKRPIITHRAPAARQDFLLRVGPVRWQQGPR